ncbi:MAG TPA: L-glutamate gamma-semialdehyde dehydrogenase [Candidatus Cloacimonetes bacterium]|nr:L-glutamate gamma-semialdehyde dehydrogenase [Candidatus Cloacimonadota bacterium]HEX37635.1 L-glutamate gamma-semialdehyde dehydrogenase [Candidatus Cloacimonadota bacterium]
MPNAKLQVPFPTNEPILGYRAGSPEKKLLKQTLKEMMNKEIEIPLIIGGKEIKTGNLGECRIPHNHKHLLGKFHKAGAKEVQMAIEVALEARKTWSEMPWEERVAIFQRAAQLLATKYRPILNAATMLTQSKNVFQAEIDSACELIDFFRFNTYYAMNIYERQPNSAPGMWNTLEHRALEGFIFAVTPFNFTSIAGNLPSAPAIMGNVALWKPASSAVYSAYYLMMLFKEAGVPDGVINFVPGSGAQVGNPALQSPELAGVHFTGSTATFQSMWKMIGGNIHNYKTYPRIVGETGGKDFIVAHSSTDIDALRTAIVRGAFEYQGQKCSAASRAYIPKSVWDKMKDPLLEDIQSLKMGDVMDFRNFINAVIDRAAYDSITDYIKYAKEANDAEILIGGTFDDSIGYFIDPTIVLTTNPHFKTMEEEIFGPVITIYVYEDEKYEDILHLCDETSPYALTGSIFANDREAILLAKEILRNAAGNFYVNDKPTGAVVGQQPFGGARASGTNDKAGDMINLLRWVSPRTIKETFNPPTDYRYPFMEEE